MNNRTGRDGFGMSVATGLLAVAIAAVPSRPAAALIIGGVGNKPIADPRWPRGAAAVFNSSARVAWCEDVLIGQPNPSRGKEQQTDPVTIDLKGGHTLGVTLHAR
jgi:hypothetical protein